MLTADIPKDARGEGFERVVPRRLVHKTAADEVLLTDAVRVRPGHFFLAVRRPAGHGLYRPDAAGAGDPTLFVEMLRQTAIYLSHRFYGVPLDHPFIFCALGFDMAAPGAGDADDGTVVLEVRCRETKERSPKRAAMTLEATLVSEGGVRATGNVTWQAVDPGRYAVVRRRGCEQPPPVPGAAVTPVQPGARVMAPELVGRERAMDVVVAELGLPDERTAAEEPGGTWLLHADQSHPVFFDHPSDHVPGMLLLEAVRQASRAALGPAPAPLCEWTMSGGRVEFAAYCELTAPARLVVRQSATPGAADEAALVVEVVQDGRTVASGSARWKAAPASGPGVVRAGAQEVVA
ncbi:lactone biosynthesis protein [Streptomyces lucensis JCM 4490]|uniref:Lactone biosynthesis protein n=1 Tax=Streptomyces lucensis JCM 4490 TaxID=1306176 RepID=A0A918JBV6_9ACTN|nr:lactone biosynthesis protein [Streptomyces lucensis JCM 4490]